MKTVTKTEFVNAKAELTAAGWTMICSIGSDSAGIRYGSHFTKNGKDFFLNKDTFIPGMTGDAMAEACLPIFNR